MAQKTEQVESFGQLLRDARVARGFTLAHLGELVGKPLSFIADMERGKSAPPKDRALMGRLAFHLRIDIQDLMVAASNQIHSGNGISEEDYGEALVQGVFESEEGAKADISEVSPLSLVNIEGSADLFRKVFMNENERVRNVNGFIDVMGFLDFISKRPLPLKEGSAIRLRADYFDLGEHESYIEGKTRYEPEHEMLTVYLREDVWASAVEGNHRARFSAAHELGHAVLHWESLVEKQGAALFRDSTITPSQSLRPGQPIYKNPEWQANSWASALLIPLPYLEDLLAGLGQYDDPESAISERFGVSRSAARSRLQKLYILSSQKR